MLVGFVGDTRRPSGQAPIRIAPASSPLQVGWGYRIAQRATATGYEKEERERKDEEGEKVALKGWG